MKHSFAVLFALTKIRICRKICRLRITYSPSKGSTFVGHCNLHKCICNYIVIFELFSLLLI